MRCSWQFLPSGTVIIILPLFDRKRHSFYVQNHFACFVCFEQKDRWAHCACFTKNAKNKENQPRFGTKFHIIPGRLTQKRFRGKMALTVDSQMSQTM